MKIYSYGIPSGSNDVPNHFKTPKDVMSEGNGKNPIASHKYV